MRALLCLMLLAGAVPWLGVATAHQTTDPNHAAGHVIPAAVERNRVEIAVEGGYRVIRSNGIPRHATGQFPNRGNPHAIRAQTHVYRVPVSPRQTGQEITKTGPIGVAVNGVPFEPGTAECYGRQRGAPRGPMTDCEWREEAIVGTTGQLGLDRNNAHVQPSGSYHYHGVPTGLLAYLADDDLVHVGYAADGFRMMVSRSGAYRPGYRLKQGTRPSGPGGRYDGRYTADFEFAGTGSLDRCNGARLNDEYVYFITTEFPFAPRCLMGVPDPSFAQRGPGAGGGSDRRRFGAPPPGPRNGRPPPRRF